MKFPTNKDEFLNLLQELGAETPHLWVSDLTEFDSKDVVEYLFLQMIWHGLENPNKSSASKEVLEHRRARVNAGARNIDDSTLGILEDMVDAGIDPTKISSLILTKQKEAVLHLLYALGDTSYGLPVELSENVNYGLFDMDENDVPIEDSRWGCPDESFFDAKPSAYTSSSDA